MSGNTGDNHLPIDKASANVLVQEFELLGLNNAKQDGSPCDAVALCLSGGGIRSATFSLGVLQGLAQMGRLKDFHYLSTVSGGGYIGAWLSAWIRRTDLTTVENALGESASGVREAEPIRWLRRYSNFLAPVRGWSSDSLALIATFARNLILHWLVLIPIMALALLIPRIVLHCIRRHIEIPETEFGSEWLTIIAPAASLLLLWLVLTLVIGVRGRFLSEHARDGWAYISGWLLAIAGIWVLLSLIVIKLPIWILELEILRSDAAAATASIGGAVLAIGSALAGYWSKEGPKIQEKANSLAEIFGVKLLEIASIASMLVILLSMTLLTSVVISIAGGRPDAAQARVAACDSAIPLVLDLSRTSSSAATLGCQRYLNHCGKYNLINSNFWLDAACKDRTPGDAKKPPPNTALSSDQEHNKAPAPAPKNEPRTSTETPHHSETSSNSPNDQKSLSRIAESKENAPSEAAPQEPNAAASSNQHKSNISRTISKEKAINLGDLNLPESIAAAVAYHHRASLYHASANYHVLIFLIVATGIGFLVGLGRYVNMFSLGAMYGNRLTQAFLGASSHEHTNGLPQTMAYGENDCALHDDFTRHENDKKTPRLFHVINTALNLTKPSADTLDWQQRKAASFVMTPMYCGGTTTGYTSTKTYESGDGAITVGKAIAISGAAVSPSMGYHSSRFVSMLLAFFNIRLGYWAENPCKTGCRRFGLWLLFREFSSNIHANSKHVYLSDGGHFENLGLYEMIRRRCKRILIVDAGHDPDYRYEDLENAIRKIRTDFGVQIIPEKRLLTPELARETQRHHLMARVIYPTEHGKDQEEGIILLLKPVLSGDEPFDLLRYAQTTRAEKGTFPQHPTSDQFFDESQFESYRALGLHSIMRALENCQDWPELDMAAFEGPEAEPSKCNKDTKRPKQSTPPWAPPQETTGFGQSLFQTLGPTGQSALLASALTVTGVVGVSGAVSLMNPTLSIDEASRKLSIDKESREFKASLAPNDTEAASGEKPPTIDLSTKIEALTESVNRLGTEIKALEVSPTPPATDFTAILTDIKESLDNLDSIAASLSKSTGNTAATSAKLAEITSKLSNNVTEVNRLIGSIKGGDSARTEPEKDVLSRLDAIQADLNRVSQELKKNSPRNNTRSAQP